MDLIHINMYPGAENCSVKHSRFAWPAIDKEEAVILADSLFKRIRHLKRASVQAIPGGKIERFVEEITKGTIDVSFQRACLIHLGTNNLAKDSPTVICEKMSTLVECVRARNPTCKIMVSGIIMRPQDEKTDIKYTRKGNPTLAETRRKANDAMELMLRGCGGFLLKTWVPLMTGPIANPAMYYEDGLHLSDAGIIRITEYLIQNIGRFLPKVPTKMGCPTRMGLI
jgi:lysophospholipase L1-like esterase